MRTHSDLLPPGTQVTYNGKPLDYWTGDKTAGRGVESSAVATP